VKKGNLPTRWVRWRRHRYQALIAQGFARHLAWPVARAEATGRHRIAGVVGDQAARDADLIVIGQGKDLRFALKGDVASLTPDQRAAIKQLNCRPSEAA
jgi:hypothetical protein